MRRYKKLIALSYLIGALLSANIILWESYFLTDMTYAITDGEEPICYVRGRETAKEVVENVHEQCVNGATVKSFSSNLQIEESPAEKAPKGTKSAEKAVINSPKAEIKVVAVEKGVTEYTPEPVIEKGEDLLAGQSEIKSEGTPGTRKYTKETVSINGVVQKEDTTDGDIVEEGSPQIIEKGTIGLPEGEDWATYEGYPVSKDGEAIAEAALSYVGKVPYVWGGKSLETGVDCSGFCIAIYRLFGVELNYPLYKQGIEVPYSEAKPGDILYFPGHYGMYIGDGKMVHAQNESTGVCVSSVSGWHLLKVTRIITE